MSHSTDINKFNLPQEIKDIIKNCPAYTVAHNIKDLVEVAYSSGKGNFQEVAYEIPGKGKIVEAQVCRVKNGIAANYMDPYMRRRDPECLLIADDKPTDKTKFADRFGKSFESTRQDTFNWLAEQELCIFFFSAGLSGKGIDTVVLGPKNAGFFAFGLALLQGINDPDNLPEDFTPASVIYIAPPLRHTHFDGKQIIVHNRLENMHELFSYNLYPGPSAKKGVYGVLLNLGEKEKWVTAHCSTVQVITPYDNKINLMHEGASGGGKSEMLEHMHRELDGRLLLGTNIETKDTRYITMPRSCDLRPVCDDMALCHPSIQKDNGKLSLIDAEESWFIRVNHIDRYGVNFDLEDITVNPGHPLLFLNIDAAPESTALIWEHIMDEDNKPCPNPRVVIPRSIMPGVINGPVTVDIRSFGVRTPPCSKTHPSYGILGLMHVLPPALAWLWRLVSPRGYANPSIVDEGGMSSEGVGSYWPFATGRYIDQANLLLDQIVQTPRTKYILCPNQHVGNWEVGFMPQWITREYLARRGGTWFTKEQVTPARCSLLGFALKTLSVEGQTIHKRFLQVENQDEIGTEAYDKGAQMLNNFFREQLEKFILPDLAPLGKTIIDCCLSNGTVEDYMSLMEGQTLYNPDL